MQENNDHSISDDMIAPADQTSMWNTIRYGGTSQQISPFARDPKEEAHRRMLALHKLWLDSLQHEYPSPYAHYRIGVYIRYFNQTRHENYLLFHKQEFMIPGRPPRMSFRKSTTKISLSAIPNGRW